MFDRIIKLIGEEKFQLIKSKTVMVIGLGGVGGYAVEGLVRSGVSNIIIVDYDKIDISNLNRQIITNNSNIGLFKTDVMEKHIKSINDNVNVIKVNKKIDLNNINELFKYKVDYIIDACDTIVVKEELIKYSVENNIKIISSMGTGNKFNVSMLKIMDIRDTSYDPIAKRIRKYLRDNNINQYIPVVSSIEKNGRFDGDIPSMMFVPASSGLLCASFVINDIIGKKIY